MCTRKIINVYIITYTCTIWCWIVFAKNRGTFSSSKCCLCCNFYKMRRIVRRLAYKAIFIGASNQLGEFESGVTAALLGPVGSVVLGGVGQLAGTVYAALGLGVLNKFLEGWMGAVLAKIAVLVLIIVFIQKRPQGIFAMKGRSAEA